MTISSLLTFIDGPEVAAWDIKPGSGWGRTYGDRQAERYIPNWSMITMHSISNTTFVPKKMKLIIKTHLCHTAVLIFQHICTPSQRPKTSAPAESLAFPASISLALMFLQGPRHEMLNVLSFELGLISLEMPSTKRLNRGDSEHDLRTYRFVSPDWTRKVDSWNSGQNMVLFALYIH